MSQTIWSGAIILEEFVCWAHEGCGVHFAVPETLVDTLRAQGRGFYCPRGHHLGFGKSEVAKLKEQVERVKGNAEFWEKRAREEEEAKRKTRAVLRGQITKLKNRVGNGVCPCCNRHFSNVERHIKHKHPNFVHEEPAA